MLDEKTRNTLLSLSTPLVTDARIRLGLPERHLDPAIRPVVPFSRMAGSAITARLEVADEAEADLAPLIQEYESQEEGSFSIIVIQIPPELHDQGIFGEGAGTLARRNGFVGALIDGGVRDTHELRDMEFPAFSRTIAPGYIVGKCSAVACGEPALIGGRTVNAGDVILGDNDGVTIILPEELEDVVLKAQEIKQWEHKFISGIADGNSAEEMSKIAGPMP